MSDQDVQEVDYQTVRRRVVRRFVKRLLFGLDVFLWIIFWVGRPPFADSTGNFLWFLLLIVHFIYAFEIWRRIVDGMTQREIESLQRKGYRVTPPMYPPTREAARNAKQKREQVTRLADDGEILFEEPPRAKSRRSQ